jgi:DNA-binding transcriptional LysR family regulator
VELRHLRYFAAVADHGSFSRASAQLRIAQPALSRQIRALERELGEELFERTAAGVTLTPTGAALIGHARQILALEAATPEVLSHGARPQEVVSVGLPPGIPGATILAMTHVLRADLPGCMVSYVEANSTEQLRLLARGSLDIAIVHQVPPAGHVTQVLWQEPLGVAVRPGHPLAQRTRCSLGDLDGLRVLIHSRNQVPTQHDSLLAAAMNVGVQPIWVFGQFVEHALASAEATAADAVLLGSHTAQQQLSGWTWRPLEDLSLAMTTWVVRRAETRTGVQAVAAVIAEHEARRPG